MNTIHVFIIEQYRVYSFLFSLLVFYDKAADIGAQMWKVQEDDEDFHTENWK